MGQAYIVRLDRDRTGKVLTGGADAALVWAIDQTEARAMVASMNEGDGDMWTSTISDGRVVAAGVDWEGWLFQVSILSGFGPGNDEPVTFEFVADATDNTIDEIAAALVVLFNAHPDIAGATYNSTTNNIEVTGVADGFGDQTLQVNFIPPGGVKGLVSLVFNIVDEGIPAAALEIEMPDDAYEVPLLTAMLKQV